MLRSLFTVGLCCVGAVLVVADESRRIIDAARNGDAAAVRSHLAATADVVHAADHDGWTALHHAVAQGYAVVGKVLLEAGADANAKHGGEMTSLHEAVERDDIELTKLLLMHGAQLDISDRNGNTAKQRALRIHHERRQGGAVPSPVVAFLTMVEHYAGLDVSPLRIHLPPPSTSHAADPPVNRNAPSTGRGPPHGEISVHDL